MSGTDAAAARARPDRGGLGSGCAAPQPAVATGVGARATPGVSRRGGSRAWTPVGGRGRGRTRGAARWARFWWLLLVLLALNWIISSLLPRPRPARPRCPTRSSSTRSTPGTSPTVTSTGDTIEGEFKKAVAYPPHGRKTPRRSTGSPRSGPSFAAGQPVRAAADARASRSTPTRRTRPRRCGSSSWSASARRCCWSACCSGSCGAARPAAARRRARRLRQVPGHALPTRGRAADDVRRRRRHRRGRARGQRDRRLPARPAEVPPARRADPARRAALRPARHRQDPAGPRGGRRGRGAVLLDLRLGVHRGDRRRRRQPGARPVRPGQEGGAVDHLHRRARRDRPRPRRRAVARRQRRARADAQPDPHRDGRLHRQRGRGRAGRHEPRRDPRPGAAAARAGSTAGSRVSPPDLAGRRKILEVHTRGVPLAPEVDLGAHRRGDPRHGRRGPEEPGQRGGAAGRPARPRPGDRAPTSPTRWRRSCSARSAASCSPPRRRSAPRTTSPATRCSAC